MSYESKTHLRRRKLSIRGIEYSICEWGDASAPLFFYLHGWGDTASTFQFVVDALRSSWRVVAPDWRGFGRSQHAPESYWFPDYIADLHDIIDAYTTAPAVRLVGHSMGGHVATLYAGTIPQRVSSFVNLEGFGLSDSDPSEAPGRYRDWIEQGRRKQTYSEYSSYDVFAGKIKKRNPGLSSAQAEFIAMEWAEMGSDGIVRLRADTKHRRSNAILYRRDEADACAQHIIAPTLMISGSNSPYAYGVRSRPPLAPPKHECAVIEGVGHMLHCEAPEAVAAQIEAHFKKTL